MNFSGFDGILLSTSDGDCVPNDRKINSGPFRIFSIIRRLWTRKGGVPGVVEKASPFIVQSPGYFKVEATFLLIRDDEFLTSPIEVGPVDVLSE